MKFQLVVFCIIASVSFNSCISNDGIHCAYVRVYNPKTGDESDYDLKVEIEEDKIVKIYWSSGGWLDETHFDPEDALLESNKASFEDDKGREFDVILKYDETACE